MPFAQRKRGGNVRPLMLSLCCTSQCGGRSLPPGSMANRGRAIYRLMVTKGEKLYIHAKHNAPLMRDHKVRLRTVTKCFTGAEFVSWLVEQKEVSKEDEAVILAQHLLENGIIHHGESALPIR